MNEQTFLFCFVRSLSRSLTHDNTAALSGKLAFVPFPVGAERSLGRGGSRMEGGRHDGQSDTELGGHRKGQFAGLACLLSTQTRSVCLTESHSVNAITNNIQP